MYCILYSFDVIPGEEERFIKAWRGLTLFYKAQANSLGSRLHQSKSGGFVAYAQWPSEAVFNAAGDRENDQAQFFSAEMKRSCRKIERLDYLQVVDDILSPVS